MYPTSTGSARIAAPAFTANEALSCGDDPYNFGSGNAVNIRDEHPRLFAPSYKWQCLPKQIAADSYMAYWFVHANRCCPNLKLTLFAAQE